MPGPGRPRKPTRLKVLEGTYRPDRAPQSEPQPDPSTPSCPTWLHPEAQREWRRLVPHLEELGLLTQVDRAALAAYCQLYARWWQAEREIEKHGMVQYTDTGYAVQRPEVGVSNTALTQMRRYLVEFGLTPAARTRIDAPTAPDKPRNAFADLG